MDRFHKHNKTISYHFSKKQTTKIMFICIFTIILAGVFFWKEKSSSIQKQQNSQSNQQLPILTKAQTFAAECRNMYDWRDCYGNKFIDLAFRLPLSYSLLVLNKLQTLDTKTYDCHILAHKMMQGAVEKDPSKWQDLLKQISFTTCNYGFIHGLVEGRARFDHTFTVNEKTIPQLCALMSKYSHSANIDATCSHIFGHLLLTENYVGNVPDSIKEATPICSKIPSALQHECYAGIFMESFTRDNLVYEGLAGRIAWGTAPVIAQQEQICNQYTPPASYGCWQEISHMYNAEFPYQPDMVYESCSHAPDTDDRNYCYMHAVATLINNRRGNQEYFTSLCQPFLYDRTLLLRCMNTAIGSLMYASVRNVDLTVSYCSSLSRDLQNACFTRTSQYVQYLIRKDKRNPYCSQLPATYQNICEGK